MGKIKIDEKDRVCFYCISMNFPQYIFGPSITCGHSKAPRFKDEWKEYGKTEMNKDGKCEYFEPNEIYFFCEGKHKIEPCEAPF